MSIQACDLHITRIFSNIGIVERTLLVRLAQSAMVHDIAEDHRNAPYDSFWCCNGTGVEEFAKFNDSIYFSR